VIKKISIFLNGVLLLIILLMIKDLSLERVIQFALIALLFANVFALLLIGIIYFLQLIKNSNKKDMEENKTNSNLRK